MTDYLIMPTVEANGGSKLTGGRPAIEFKKSSNANGSIKASKSGSISSNSSNSGCEDNEFKQEPLINDDDDYDEDDQDSVNDDDGEAGSSRSFSTCSSSNVKSALCSSSLLSNQSNRRKQNKPIR